MELTDRKKSDSISIRVPFYIIPFEHQEMLLTDIMLQLNVFQLLLMEEIVALTCQSIFNENENKANSAA